MGRGGSRYGAGRPGWRRKCEMSLPIDIRRLHRKGLLRAGSAFGWHWSLDDEPRGNIGIAVADGGLRFSYSWTPGGAEPRNMGYTVRTDRSSCHFGGARSWFLCPRCTRRCAILYGLSRRDGYFGCRRCLRLGYSSEAESLIDRLWRKQRKLESKLNWIEGDVPDRPKGMRNRTFENILNRINAVEEAKDADFFEKIERLSQACGWNLEDLLK
jgi:hypothetical protein